MSEWIENGPAVRYEIRRNADGLIREVCSGMSWHGDFIWGEGNFACDCNREIFFCDAAGEDDSNRHCGHEAYSVRVTAVDDGRLIYQDHDW